MCPGGYTARGIVLGTDFITDVLLISVTVDGPLNLTPSYLATQIALRTLCEALSKAACSILELEPTELQGEFRPAVTALGAQGLQMELYLYDTLSGGAGFAKQVEGLGRRLFEKALHILRDCPEQCDRSCYRCLRSYKNKFDHEYLDRYVGAALLEYLLYDDGPHWNQARLETSREILSEDLRRRNQPAVEIARNKAVDIGDGTQIIAPIAIEIGGTLKAIVDISGALTPTLPADRALKDFVEYSLIPVLLVEELTVRRNLQSATNDICDRLHL